MRKVKFAQDAFDEKLAAILNEFPMLDVRPAIFLQMDDFDSQFFGNRTFTHSYPH